MLSLSVKFSQSSRKIELKPYNGATVECELVKSEQRDRRIVRVLRKYLDMEFKAGELEILKRSDFEALGELLFELIFYDNNAKNQFQEFYKKSYLSKESYGHINIYLEFEKDNEFEDLAILPWEYIYYKPKQNILIGNYPFLAADAEIKFNFFRKLPYTEFVIKDLNAYDPEKFQLTPPLKILLILSQPSDKLLMKKGEEVLESFAHLADKFRDWMEIRFLSQPTENFSEELRAGKEIEEHFKKFNFTSHDKDFKPDIIHFIGHGQIKNENGILLFVKKDEYQPDKYDIQELKDEDFAKAIAFAHLEPKLVFLQVCNGGRIIDYINDQGIAIRLLLKKIPFVIAMQNPIEEDQALKFAEKFYERFLEGDDIGLAVTEGRCLLGYESEYSRKSFGSPVLYTYVEHPLQLVLKKQESSDNLQPEKYKVCQNKTCEKHKSNFHFPVEYKICFLCGSELVTIGERVRATNKIATLEPESVSDVRSAQPDTTNRPLASSGSAR